MSIKNTVSGILDWILLPQESGEGSDPIATLEEQLTGKKEYTYEGSAVRKPESTWTQPKQTKTPSNVTNFKGAGMNGPELMVIEPRSFAEDANQMITYLQDGKTIVLNFQLLDKVDAQRLIDFVSGATRALGGHQQKISDTVFIFAPVNTSISADSKAKAAMEGIWAQRQY